MNMMPWVIYFRLSTFFLQTQHKWRFLIERDHPLETLAILYSLPYALLIWGYVFSLYFQFCCNLDCYYYSVRCHSSSHSVSCASKIPLWPLEVSLACSAQPSPYLLAGASGLAGKSKRRSDQSQHLPMRGENQNLTTPVATVRWSLKRRKRGRACSTGSRVS